MDVVNHHPRSQVHSSHNISSTILPASSMRDIVSFIFVLSALPQSISLILLICHIVLNSQYSGGKIISRVFVNDRRAVLDGYKEIIWGVMKVLVVNSMLYYILKHVFFKKKAYVFQYLILLSKSIISCDVIGVSYISTSISNKKFLSKIHYENKIVDAHLINLVTCYILVNYVHYIISWLKMGAIFSHPGHYNKYYVILSLHTITSSFVEKILYSKNVEEISSKVSHATQETDRVTVVDASKVSGLSSQDIKNSSVILKNFENFISNPCNNNRSLILKNKYSTSISIKFQPFWSVFAGIKAVIQNPNVFNGKKTKWKNGGGELIPSPTPSVRVSILSIDDSRIFLEFMDKIDSIDESFTVKINKIIWSCYKVVESGKQKCLLIYGLTSLFQYEIDLIFNGTIINHLVINTTDHKRVLNRSLKDNSSLVTLRISLMSTINNLNDIKSQFSKLKKEENKKLTDLKNNIDTLKSKISKYNEKGIHTNTRSFGRMRGLTHVTSQLEENISDLESRLHNLNQRESKLKEDFEKQEKLKLNEITVLYDRIKAHENEMTTEKNRIKRLNVEEQTFLAKKTKFLNKEQHKLEEIQKFQNDLKSIKKQDIIAKFQKRSKKNSERYETIIPKVLDATVELQSELEELLNA